MSSIHTGTGGMSAYAASVVEGSAEESDGDSVAPWGERDEDRARVQADELELASRFLAQTTANVLGDGDVSDEGDTRSSVSSGGSAGAQARERRAEVMQELTELAGRLSRVSAMRAAATYRKGRVARGGPRIGVEVSQKVFGLEGSETLTDLEEAGGLYGRLMMGETVMTQYIARTGIGKTTRFPAMIAEKCGARVLLLEPDMLLSKAAAEAQRERTRVRVSWSRTRMKQLTTMTYDDFCGQFFSNNGRMMLEQFDVIVMDEAHIPFASVYVAKALIATYGNGRVSLLILSATLDGDDSQAINNAVTPKYLDGTLVDAVESGKLTTGQRSRDRTMLIVPTDEEAARCQRKIEEDGHTAYMLDSASRFVDCQNVRAMMTPPAVVKRYLVVTEKYGTGHNFPVSFVYTDASRRVYVMDEVTRKVAAQMVPVTVSEVKQHVARVGRGMAQGGQSYVFTGRGDAIPDTELISTERVRAYLMLRAAGVRPLTTLKPPVGFFPFGVTPEVAADILALCLPVEVAVRFFNRDGRMSVAYAKAVRPFSLLQHYFLTSPQDKPIGSEKWVNVAVGDCYGMCSRGDVTVQLPFDVEEDELRTKLLAIAAGARGSLTIHDFMPQLSESENSGDETGIESKRVSGRILPRLIESAKPLPPPPVATVPWGFDAQIEGQMGYKGDRNGVVAADSYTQVTLDYLQSLDNTRVVAVPTTPVKEVRDKRGVSRVEVLSNVGVPAECESATPVDVETPGGSVIFTLRADVWRDMSQARVLKCDEISSLIRAIRYNVPGFIRSNVFANWSNAWISMLRTFADEDVLTHIQNRGQMSVVQNLIHAMYLRYRTGIQTVSDNSYVRAKFLKRMFNGRSVQQQLEADQKKGKVEIIQSEAFFKRIAEIRSYTTDALFKMEEFGVFAPNTSTELQRVNPITRHVGNDMIDVVVSNVRTPFLRRIGGLASPKGESKLSSSFRR